MAATYEGWAPDPFDRRELRYFVDGRPTKLVKDGVTEDFDDLPPRSTWPASVQAVWMAEPVTEDPAEPVMQTLVDPAMYDPAELVMQDPVELIVEAPAEPVMPIEPMLQVPSEPVVPVESVFQTPVEPLMPVEPVMQVPAEPVVPVESVFQTQVEPVVQAPAEPAMPVEPEMPVMQTPVEPNMQTSAEPAMQTPPPPPPPLGASYWSPPPPPPPSAAPQQPEAFFAGPTSSVQDSGEPSGLGLDDTFVVGTEPTPARRPRRRVAAALAIVVVAAAATSVVAVVSSGKSAEAAVIDSVNTTMADKGAHVDMTVVVHSPSSTLTETGTGAVDFGQNALDLQFTVNEAGQKIPVTAVYIGGSLYESTAGLDQLVPGKSWISIDLRSLVAASQNSGALGTGNNPTAMLRLLAQQGNTVTPLGSSTINGAVVQGYSVRLNASSIKAQLAHADLPSWMTTALSQINIDSVTNNVYVDSAGLLRRYNVSLTESAPKGTTSLDETLDFSIYGRVVSVSARLPPAR